MSQKDKPVGNFIRDGLKSFFSIYSEAAGAGLLVAYSGGIDSATLLSALAKSEIRPLRAIHVVHNLRPASELRMERETVVSFCASLGIPLTVATIKRGAIKKLAKEKRIGIEAAARELRYGILKRTAKRFGFAFIGTAHNADDQFETLLSRFIAASSIDGLAGMETVHDFGDGIQLIRPLLFASRKDIERYAEVEHLPISGDSTNLSLEYTRNRIRHEIIPILDRDFRGWRKGLLGTSAKLALDKIVVNDSLRQAMNACTIDAAKKKASIGIDVFLRSPEAIRIRILAQCVAAITGISRLSHNALREASRSIACGAAGVDLLGTRISLRGSLLEILPVLDFRLEDRYFFEIPSEGTYLAGPVQVSVWWEEGESAEHFPQKGQGFLFEGAFSFPLIVRSRKAGDEIQAGNGKIRLDDIMKSWHLAPGWRDKVPVVEDRRGIVAILASSLDNAGLKYEKYRDYHGSKAAQRLYISVKGA